MMDMQEIEVAIDPEGKVMLKVKGAKGKMCLELTKPLEDALGAEVESRSYTSEYYESVKTGQKNTAR
jgi:hypothetical protein